MIFLSVVQHNKTPPSVWSGICYDWLPNSVESCQRRRKDGLQWQEFPVDVSSISLCFSLYDTSHPFQEQMATTKQSSWFIWRLGRHEDTRRWGLFELNENLVVVFFAKKERNIHVTLLKVGPGTLSLRKWAGEPYRSHIFTAADLQVGLQATLTP